jgi:unsaturated chondroitin disaccharide hydrolase
MKSIMLLLLIICSVALTVPANRAAPRGLGAGLFATSLHAVSPLLPPHKASTPSGSDYVGLSAAIPAADSTVRRLSQNKPIDTKAIMAIVKQHLRNSLAANKYPFRYPRSVNADGSIISVESRDWTSGYDPGNLWQMYEYTRDGKWLSAAQKWNIGLEKERKSTHTHDLGLMLYCSFGHGYRLLQEEKYKGILLEGAASLSTRFNEKTGCIRSWDHGKWEFPVIIDNMMNLELLFRATQLGGDSTFHRIAVSHANTTIKNHFRDDNSSYHVVDYDTVTGAPKSKVTHQGYSDASAWSRGQAWGLYGYAMSYRFTKDKKYLEQAEKIADFYLSHPNLPADKVPYWDFDAPNIPNEPRDASAAAIAASGLLELSTYSKDSVRYFSAAENMLRSLSSPEYLATPGTNHDFVLKHSVGHKTANREVDVPIVFADYYFIEALLRYERILKLED